MDLLTSGDVLSLLPMLFNVVLHGAMLIVPVYCIIKRPTPQAYLMLVGLVLELPGTLFTMWWNIWGINLNMPFEDISRYFGIFGAVTFIGAMAFACGFLVFVHDVVRKRVTI